jgi:aminoglycoside phosphotransferase (APT) family kinase protein
MRRYLIVANQTLGADQLVNFVRTRNEAEPSEFFIVVPATPTMEMVHGAEGVAAVGGSTLLPSSPEHARELAQERLEKALAQLHEIGATVDGQVGHRDPVHAVEAALQGRQFDEIVVSTLPKRVSRWLHQDLPRRLEHKTHLPVTHVGANR